jgi:hypothetical protein
MFSLASLVCPLPDHTSLTTIGTSGNSSGNLSLTIHHVASQAASGQRGCFPGRLFGFLVLIPYSFAISSARTRLKAHSLFHFLCQEHILLCGPKLPRSQLPLCKPHIVRCQPRRVCQTIHDASANLPHHTAGLFFPILPFHLSVWFLQTPLPSTILIHKAILIQSNSAPLSSHEVSLLPDCSH